MATSTLSIRGSKPAIVQCTNFAYTDCEGDVTCKSALQQLYTARAILAGVMWYLLLKYALSIDNFHSKLTGCSWPIGLALRYLVNAVLQHFCLYTCLYFITKNIVRYIIATLQNIGHCFDKLCGYLSYIINS